MLSWKNAEEDPDLKELADEIQSEIQAAVQVSSGPRVRTADPVISTAAAATASNTAISILP